MLGYNSSGSFDNLEKFLKKVLAKDIIPSLDSYAQQGVAALSAATPAESGFTASSWGYEIIRDADETSIIWTNTHVVDDTPVVILLQYGHGTGTGGYVQGRDFINPALQPLFDKIAADVWRVVSNS